MSVIGAPVRLTATFTDADGTAVDPTTVTANLTLPDGTVASNAATRDSVGHYHYDYTPTQSGIHQFYFTGTGTNASVQTPDIFTVQPVTTGALISLADAKEQLNKAPTSPNPAGSSDDEEILGFIQAASSIINHICGYTAATTFTEWVTPSWGSMNNSLGVYGSGYVPIALSRTPVLSVTSIQPQFYNVGAASLVGQVVDAEGGIVQMQTSNLFLGPCLVTYRAGRTVVPPALQTAARIIVQSLWETQRGPASRSGGSNWGRPSMGSDDDMVNIPGLDVAIPGRAYELLNTSGYHAAPGFA